MTKLPGIDYDKAIRALRKEGWVVVRQRGSHIRLHKHTGEEKLKLTIPATQTDRIITAMSKKKSQQPPRRKRMTRQNRLQHAKDTGWLERYRGKNIVKGYCKWFGVDQICALTELRILGTEISEEKEAEIRKAVEGRARARRHQKEAAAQKKLDDLYVDSDETFAFIAGYTSGGAPYGTKWEELYESELGDGFDI